MLQQAGLEWLNKNLSSFISGTDRGNQAMRETGEAASGASPGVSLLSGAVMGVANAITTQLIGAVQKGIGALVGFGQESVALATEFEGMRTGLEIAGRAASEAAGVPLEELGEIALAVGGDTRLLGVSATGAADAMTGLLKNGLSLTDVLGDVNNYMEEGGQLGGVLRASIDLAAATELDMVRASDLAGASMKIFGLETEDTLKVMDYFVRAADASAADVTDIEQAMVNAGPSMRNMGFTVEETADAIALLANTGIRGSEAGTALRSAFGNLARMTPKVTEALEAQGIALADENGQFYDMFNIVGQLKVATADMNEREMQAFLQTIGGTYGQKALTSLMNQVDTLDAYQYSLQNAMGIAAQSEARAQTFSGQMEALEGNIETLKIRIGDALLPALKGVVGWFSKIVDRYGPYLINTFELIGAWLGEEIPRALEALSSLFSGDFTNAISNIGAIISDTFGRKAASGFLQLVAGAKEFIANMKEIGSKVLAALQPVIEFIQNNVELKDVLIAIGLIVGSVIIPAILSAVAAAGQAVAIFSLIVAAVSTLRQAWENDWGGIRTNLTTFWNDTAKPALEQLWQWLQVNIPLAIQALANYWTTTLWPAMQNVWGWVQTYVLPLLTELGNMILAFPETLNIWAQNWQMFKDILATVWEGIKAAVQDGIDAIVNFWSVGNSSLWQDIFTIWTGVFNFITWVMKQILNVVNLILDMTTQRWQMALNFVKEVLNIWWSGFSAYWLEIWNKVQEILSVALDTIKVIFTNSTQAFFEIISNGFNTIVAFVSNAMEMWRLVVNAIASLMRGDTKQFMDDLKKFIDLGWENIKLIVSGSMETLHTVLSTSWENIKTLFKNSIENIKTAFRKVDWRSIGRSIIDGIASGIRNAAQRLAQSAARAAKSALDAAKNALGIHSPSKKAREQIGQPFGEGEALGILDMLPQIRAAAEKLSTEALRAPQAMLPPTMTNVSNTKQTTVQINPTYANQQSEASIYYDVSAALAAANL